MSRSSSDILRTLMNLKRALVPLVCLGLLAAVVVTLVLGLVGVPWAIAVGVGVVIGVGIAYWLWRRTPGRVLSSLGATPIPEGSEPRLENLVEGLCVSHGFPAPGLFVVEEATMNAAVVASSHDHPALVFTRGLIDSLDQVSLEGVLAHLLVIARDENASAATHLVPFLRSGLTRPLVAPALNAAIEEQRVVVADLAGVALTRYPPGLIAALETIAATGSAVAAAPAVTAHLWLAPIAFGSDPDLAGAAALHPTLELRIATLREL